MLLCQWMGLPPEGMTLGGSAMASVFPGPSSCARQCVLCLWKGPQGRSQLPPPSLPCSPVSLSSPFTHSRIALPSGSHPAFYRSSMQNQHRINNRPCFPLRQAKCEGYLPAPWSFNIKHYSFSGYAVLCKHLQVNSHSNRCSHRHWAG